MSSRQQEGAAARQAPKLPQFPARKPAIAIGQSPVGRKRVDSLPGVPSPGRPALTRWGRTGAEKLIQLQTRSVAAASKDDSLDDDSGGVEGFESPQLAKARAQVARDEVLSYMHHRRYQRKDMGVPVEPRDTSFDDSDADDDSALALTGGRAAAGHGSSGGATQLLHRVQQALDRWPPGRQALQQHHHNFGDDDLQPASADQSPTRHAHNYMKESAGSLSLALPAVVAAERTTTMSSRGGTGADSSTAVSRAGPGRRSIAAKGLLVESRDPAGRDGASGSLSEGAFELFKRDVAARVIQTHWRRWQDWKAKVRREAEERILQQLLSDDSGISLRMLLGGGGRSERSEGGTTGRDSAGGSSTSLVHPAAAPRPASAQAASSHSNPSQQLGRLTQHGRPSGGGAGLGRLRGGLAGEGRPAPIRPASAAAATGPSRGKSPARLGRVTEPAAVTASPARGGRAIPGNQVARGNANAGRGQSFDLDDLKEESQRDAGGVGKATVLPSRKHAGGHAVYTFIATPQKQAEATAALKPSCEGVPVDDESCQRPSSQASNTTADRPASTSTTVAAAPQPTEPLFSDCKDTDTCSGLDCSGTASGDLRFAPVPKPGPCPPSPSQQRQASLDADTNPAMASPALSMGTDGGSGDTVLGPASPVASMAGSSINTVSHSSTNTNSQPSANTGSQPPTTVAFRPDRPAAQLEPQGRLGGPRYHDAPSGLQPQTETVQRQQQQQQQQRKELLQQQRAHSDATRDAIAVQHGPMVNVSAGLAEHLPHTQQHWHHLRATASPPMSPTRHSPAPPLQPPPQDGSPSPQRQARTEALRRLKLQGSLRGGSGVPRNVFSGPAQSHLAPLESAAAPPEELRPQSAMDEAPARRHGTRGNDLQKERGITEASDKPHSTAHPNPDDGDGQAAPDMAPSDEQQLSPRVFQPRQQVWQDESRGLEEGQCFSRQQQHAARDAESRGWGHQLDKDQLPRQRLPAEPQALLQQELSEEASLRALHEAGGLAAANHWRQASNAQHAHPEPQSGALTQRRHGHSARRPDSNSPPRCAQGQQLVDGRDEASKQYLICRLDRGLDLVAAYPGPLVDSSGTSQPIASQRPGAGRPLSAAAAEQTARLRGASGASGAQQPRIALAGDDSLAQLGTRGQQRQPVQGPAVAAAADRCHVEAWPERLAKDDIVDSEDRTVEGQQGKDFAASARDTEGFTAKDAAQGGAAPNPRQQPADCGLGDESASGPYVGGIGAAGNGALTQPMERQETPCSGRLHSVAGAKHSGGDGVRNGGGLGAEGSAGSENIGTAGASPRADVDGSMTAKKMSSILKYLEEVELQADKEATCAALAPVLLASEPTAAAAVTAALLPGGMSIVRAHQRGVAGAGRGAGGDGGGRARRYDTASATSTGTRQITNSSHLGTAHTTVSQMGLQRSQAALSDAGTAFNRSGFGGRSQAGRRRATRSTTLEADDALEAALEEEEEEDGQEDEGMDADDDAVSVATRSTVVGLTNRPAFLAESVYENVRAKIRRLQDDVKQKDARINELAQEIESLHAAQRTYLLDADARLTEMLAAQRAEYEAAVSRHMAFVDRLLADKEALTGRVQQLAEQLQSADERQERAIAKLKEGWATELKRQKEGWTASEKQRREAWMQSKAVEIKDVTIKGLEGEVQKLLTRHRAELSAAQRAAADEAKRHLDSYIAQNEAAVRQLKDRMSREAEEAVEKERAAAATRLREVSERYEQQLQIQRMRLMADADMRLEQLEQARKEDKKRYEEAVAAAKEAGESRLKDAEEDWRREKDAVRKAHEKQIDTLREQYETGQEGWRAAMAERARKEVSERVAAIREKLMQERNEEVQAVMTRLEAEHVAAIDALKEDFRRREEATANRAAAALKEARRAEAKMAERFRNAGGATKAAEERLAASELTVSDLRRELEARNTTIRFLESQVSAAKDEAAARERDVRSLGAEKAAVAAEVAAAVARDKQQVEARLAQAIQEAQDLRSRHSAEMAAVEARVRATLARKDEVIAGLREQLATMAAELRTTQEVLRQQQEELGSELDGACGGGGASGRDVRAEVGGRRGGRY